MRDLVRYKRGADSHAAIFARKLPDGRIYFSADEPTKRDLARFKKWLKSAMRTSTARRGAKEK